MTSIQTGKRSSNITLFQKIISKQLLLPNIQCMHSPQAPLNIASEFGKYRDLRGCSKVITKCHPHNFEIHSKHLNRGRLLFSMVEAS